VDPRAERPEPTQSEDEIARELIERISREVDLAFGRKPLVPESDSESEDASDEAEDEPAVQSAAEVAEKPAERSEEDVARELIERIAHEVDEEERG
jgi:hypothetical protein